MKGRMEGRMEGRIRREREGKVHIQERIERWRLEGEGEREREREKLSI